MDIWWTKMRVVYEFVPYGHFKCSFGCRFLHKELVSLLSGFNFRAISELWPAKVAKLINIMWFIYVLLLVVGADLALSQRVLLKGLLEGSCHSVVIIKLLKSIEVGQLILASLDVV